MMNTGKKISKRKNNQNTQSGNAMIYVLVVVALFAALSYLLARESDTSETSVIQGEKDEIFVNQIMQLPMQIQQGINQMSFTGTRPDQLDFVTVDDADFETGSHIHKVFHPQGGGISMPRLTEEMINEVSGESPAPGWYIGMFNDVEWTPSTNNDVIMVAHQITQSLCALINEKLTGSSTIPTLTDPINELLIDAASSTASSNSDFTTTECAACENNLAMCVKDDDATLYSFYNIISPN